MLDRLSLINHSKFGIVNFLLLPLSLVYFVFSKIHFWLYKFNVLDVNISKVPIVVVGNITVGGTGNTPIVFQLLFILNQRIKRL